MIPRVSFICTSYNYGRFVSRAVDSLLDQDFEALELIIIDDASTDDTAAIVARYAEHPNIRLVRHARNQGHIRSYNEGLALARGEFVAIMSADDYSVNRRAVSRAVALFDAYSAVGMVYGSHVVVEDGQVIRQVAPWPEDRVIPGRAEFRRLMWGNDILHSGTLVRRVVQDRLGPYDERLTQSGDWDMWLRIAARHDVGYVAGPLFAYRIHGVNMQKKGISPAIQAEQNVLALRRGFAALPSDAPADLLAARAAALRHARLQTGYFDLFNGRRGRAWHGIVHALRREPALILSTELNRLAARFLFMLVAGRRRYRASFVPGAERRRYGAALP
jgi:glycosyltransferase involved in cell wall biosynthesis